MRRRIAGLQVLVLLAGMLLPTLAVLTTLPAQPVEAAQGFANDAFRRVWNRTDQPVEEGAVRRSWIWGDKPLNINNEPYSNSPGGNRQVQYFDKSRMEINNPSTNFVTNGLLATELITGRLQKGDADFEQREPATVNIAGDPDDADGPTYASLTGVLGAPPMDEGAVITETLGRRGNVGNDPGRAGRNVRAGNLINETRHRIASVFWDFLNTTGPVQTDAGRRNERLFDPWYAAGGLPISRAYWTQVKVGGQAKDVLLQCFERRCLTYTPDNPEGFRVEMGNIGRHYFRWRYNEDPTPSAGGPPPPPPPGSVFQRGPDLGFGFNGFFTFGTDQASLQRSMNLVNDANFRWVRQQIVWATLEPNPGQYDSGQLAQYDSIVREAAARNIRIMFSVVKGPRWSARAEACEGDHCGLPDDPQNFGRLVTFLAQRYKAPDDVPANRTTVAAFEIWNEQNTGGETGKNVNAGAYVELLKVAYAAIKNVDPRYIVVYGGLTPTGVNDRTVAIDDVVYLRQTYQYNNGEMKRYFDVLGAHPGSNNNSPDQLWPENPGPGTGCNPPGNCWRDHPSFYFRRIEALRRVMEEFGDAEKKVWLTEFGWTTRNEAPGYEYGSVISEELQAQYLTRALQKGCNEYGWIGVMFIWTLNHSVVTQPSDEKYPWSVVRGDWSPRPSYDAIKALNKQRNRC